MIDNINILQNSKGKKLTRILASDVCIRSNEKWYDCLAVKIAFLPSIGHLDLSYEFDQIEFPTLHNFNKFKFGISALPDSLHKNYNFKMLFGGDFIVNRITLFGGKITFSNKLQIEQLNILLIEKSSFEKILFIPDYNSSRVNFTIDKNEIHEYLTNLSVNSSEEFEFKSLEL